MFPADKHCCNFLQAIAYLFLFYLVILVHQFSEGKLKCNSFINLLPILNSVCGYELANIVEQLREENGQNFAKVNKDIKDLKENQGNDHDHDYDYDDYDYDYDYDYDHDYHSDPAHKEGQVILKTPTLKKIKDCARAFELGDPELIKQDHHNFVKNSCTKLKPLTDSMKEALKNAELSNQMDVEIYKGKLLDILKFPHQPRVYGRISEQAKDVFRTLLSQRAPQPAHRFLHDMERFRAELEDLGIWEESANNGFKQQDDIFRSLVADISTFIAVEDNILLGANLPANRDYGAGHHRTELLAEFFSKPEIQAINGQIGAGALPNIGSWQTAVFVLYDAQVNGAVEEKKIQLKPKITEYQAALKLQKAWGRKENLMIQFAEEGHGEGYRCSWGKSKTEVTGPLSGYVFKLDSQGVPILPDLSGSPFKKCEADLKTQPAAPQPASNIFKEGDEYFYYKDYDHYANKLQFEENNKVPVPKVRRRRRAEGKKKKV